MCVVVPLDPAEGTWYTEHVHTKEELDHIYKITAQDEDRVNPMDEGMLYWEKDSECLSDSDEELQNWQIWLHEDSALRSLQTVRNFRRISTIEITLPCQEDAYDTHKPAKPNGFIECRSEALPLTRYEAPTQGPVSPTRRKYWSRVILHIETPLAR